MLSCADPACRCDALLAGLRRTEEIRDDGAVRNRAQIAAQIYFVGFPELADPILSTPRERATCQNVLAAKRRQER